MEASGEPQAGHYQNSCAVSIFRLDFADQQDMRPDVSGKPVCLRLMMNADGIVKLKPQNLLASLLLRALA